MYTAAVVAYATDVNRAASAIVATGDAACVAFDVAVGVVVDDAVVVGDAAASGATHATGDVEARGWVLLPLKLRVSLAEMLPLRIKRTQPHTHTNTHTHMHARIQSKAMQTHLHSSTQAYRKT
jgi:hypothetical protein